MHRQRDKTPEDKRIRQAQKTPHTHKHFTQRERKRQAGTQRDRYLSEKEREGR